MMLNRAVYDSIEPLVNVYLKGKIDPRIAAASANSLSWKQLSKEEKDLFLKQVNEERARDNKKPLTNKGVVFEYNKRQAEKVKALQDLSKQYAEHMHSHTDQDDTVDSKDVDAESMQREAADLLFDHEMQYHEEMKRINHREYLRNAASPTEIREGATVLNSDASTVEGEGMDSIIESLGQNTDIPQDVQ